MSKRAKLAIAIGGSLLAICLLTALHRHREPTYNGLTMSQWLSRLDYAQRGEALLILGTNNLDLLLMRLSYDPRKDWLWRDINKLPGNLQKTLRLDRLASRRANRGYEAFRVLATLGTNAAAAIPKLEGLVERGGPPSVHALDLLGHMGPDGLAIVASKGTHTNAAVRLYALGILAEFRDSAVALRTLTNALADPDRDVREAAYFLLRRPQ